MVVSHYKSWPSRVEIGVPCALISHSGAAFHPPSPSHSPSGDKTCRLDQDRTSQARFVLYNGIIS
ncbi:hypothetical protein J6590_106358, partial [Homalodisca vitripennis]